MVAIGVVYVVYGPNAVKEATASIRSLRKQHDWPIAVIGDRIEDTQHVECPDTSLPGRWAKVNLLDLSPYRRTLLLDADTRVHGKLDIGFGMLADGWDLVMVPSKTECRSLHNLVPEERDATLSGLGDSFPLMLNTGVMWLGRSGRMERLFGAWRREWLRFKQHDQGALLRALEGCPVRLILLGPDFNSAGGSVIDHRFGRARA